MSSLVYQEDAESGDDVVITGMGVFSPLGHDITEHFEKLAQGLSAVRVVEPIQGVDGSFWLGATIEGFDPKQHVQPRKAIKVMCREIQLAFGSAMQACHAAGISSGTVEPDRIGTVFSGEIILSDLQDVEEIVRRCAIEGVMPHERWSVEAMENMYPLWMLKSLPNMAACHVGIALDARGPNNTVTTEGTSSLGAMLEAINVIRRDKADVMLVGSTASRVNPSRLLQRHEEDFSRRHLDGAAACKPFDSLRDGTVPGEASSCMVLERRRHALARNAPILATIRAGVSRFSPSPTGRWGGVERATMAVLHALLQSSGARPEHIDHINASANGTQIGDAAEARGIAAHLPGVPAVSYKGAFGDSISASGLLECISSLKGMGEGVIPPTTNHTSTDSNCPIDVIRGKPKSRTVNSFVKLSHTPAGRCAGVLVSVSK
ncbi:3-oxoacyl-[acyl-carrier-protein] synthase 2 [Pirellula sp. SH-Sr6A]|uniref:beta-ketoacyl-[acyl-carrier-protein] synthase family protein n=1 Tax=Pirellula sp. SH-Sr6A TaxID=1632865 RepID=UPI00078B2097|nr:beta-ketoacyl synthase N-terminal-like domain-containing protein [Pirellula sp. SH-Sr6A]AMV34505.1 3-oxoacyl-[acyl-carrier-protein] synthase 2 [Pirellula sp. SH-Sr6A]